MVRFNLRGRLPDRSSIGNRLPSEETRTKFKIYGALGLAVMTLTLGGTLSLSGLVLIPMMAFAYNVLGVIGAATLVTAGATLAGVAYMWLTNPV